MSWETANLGPRARRVAEDAAHRAGMSPEDWLNEAIVEHAAFVGLEEAGEDVQFYDRRRERVSARGERAVSLGGRRTGRPRDEQVPEVEDLLESTLQQIERRITHNGRRLAEAFEAIALRIERSNASLDRAAFAEEQPRSDAAVLPQTVAAPLSLKGGGAGATPVSTGRSNTDPCFSGEVSEDERRLANSAPSPGAPRVRPALASEQSRLDLKSAVSQIALRRRELDSREARKPLPPASPTLETGRAETGLGAEALSVGPRQAQEGEVDRQGGDARDPADQRDDAARNDSNRRQTGAPGEPSQTVRDDIRALASKLDTVLRTDQRISVADVNAMRGEIAAMARSLADLAPRNAIVALEGAVRDLTERVDKLRQSGCRESLLAPLDTMAAEFRAALKAHDPRLAAAALEREIGAIGAKIDGLAQSAINPETFERIRIQTEEVRNLLAAAAMRTAPVERLERQIGELADRVEDSAPVLCRMSNPPRWRPRLPTFAGKSSAPHRCRLSSRSNNGSSVSRRGSTRRSLARFKPPSTRLRSTTWRSGSMAFVRTLEARPQAEVDANRLEASLKELSAKLENPNPEPLVALMREINAKLDAAGQRDIQGSSIEPLLEIVIRKLDQLQPPEGSVSSLDLRSLEDLLQSLHAKLEKPSVPGFDREAIDEIADEIARRVHDGSAAQSRGRSAGRADRCHPR